LSDKDSVEEIMSKTVRTIDSSGTVGRVLETMANYDIGSVVVVDGKRPVGMVTERDFARKYAREKTAKMEWKIGEISSKAVISVAPETKVWDALDLMVTKKIRQLPVVKHDELVGIVTERDIFKWIVRVIYSPNIPNELKKTIAQNL
jgi:CBS domain-containing protein